jgi:hypothetical protein
MLQQISKTSKENSIQLEELCRTLKKSSEDRSDNHRELADGLGCLHFRQDIQEHDEKRQTIFNWLASIDYAPQQNDFIRRRQAGTGLWLLKSPEYQDWLATAIDTLFCPGIPGAGKTIRTSVVVEDLYNKFRDQADIGIAHLYCNFRRRATQTIEDLMSNLLRQVSQHIPSIPMSVRALYERHEKRRTRPLQEEIVEAIKSVLGNFFRVFIVVDALDERHNSDNCRSLPISKILDLRTKNGSNVLATSRFTPEITERFERASIIEILQVKRMSAITLKGNFRRCQDLLFVTLIFRNRSRQVQSRLLLIECV